MIGKIESSVTAVIDIDNTPSLLQTVTVLTSVPCTATIIDIDEGKTATGPVLIASVERVCGPSGRSTMRDHTKRG